MRRVLLSVLVVTGVVLGSGPARPAGAQEGAAVTAPGLDDFFELIDPDGEPCTAVPNSIPGLFDFGTACQAHDLCYVQGGDNTACDTAFRTDMVALCAAQFPSVFDPRAYFCLFVAELYYIGVFIYGQLT